MSDGQDSILIFSPGGVAPTFGTTRGLCESVQGASEVAVSTLQKNMSRFLLGLGTIITIQPEDIGGLELDQVEVSAQVDSKGNVGLWGLATAELATHGGIKLILRKKKKIVIESERESKT